MRIDEFRPYPGEVEEAKRNPGGWVYRIAGHFKENEDIPREAIVGAWRVSEDGKIVGEFLKNRNYDAKAWPAKSPYLS